MHCYNFELVRAILTDKLTEIGARTQYDALDLTDILMEHGVTSVEQIADIVSIARNLQLGIRLAA